MDDGAALEEVVRALRDEVERRKCHEKRLQRENRVLLQTVLRLQQRHKQQNEEESIHHEEEEKENENNDNITIVEELWARVAALEEQLELERSRRRAQAAESTAELEKLRLALEEAKLSAGKHQIPGVDTVQTAAPAGTALMDNNNNHHHHHRCQLGDAVEPLPRVYSLQESANTPSSTTDSSHTPISNRHNNNNNCDVVSPHSEEDEEKKKRKMNEMPQLILSPHDELTCTSASDDFLIRTFSRMEGRRRRMRNAVMLYSHEEGEVNNNNDNNEDPLHGGSEHYYYSHNDNNMKPHSLEELPPSPSSPANSFQRRSRRRVAHRRTVSWSACQSDDATHDVSRQKTPISTPGIYSLHNNNNNNNNNAAAAMSGGGGGSSVLNPNQLGVEVDPRGPHNRTWYFHQVLRLALSKTVHTSSSSSSAQTTRSSGEACNRCTTEELQQQQQQQEYLRSGSHYLPSDTSDSSDVEEEEERPHVIKEEDNNDDNDNDDDDASPRRSSLRMSRGMYCNISHSSVRHAIGEVIRLRLRCHHNKPILETPAAPFPPTLPQFHEENTDGELIRAFAPGFASPGRCREDEVCMTVHSPVLFSQIRSFLGVDTDGLRMSLGEDVVWRQAVSPGKSGSTLIYFGNYVMKSLKETEFNFLKTKFLRHYVSYCERNPDTLLTRLLALVSFSWLKDRSCTRYVLMQNVLATQHYIHRIYDVKGSTVGRSTATENAPRTSFGALLLKDNDLPAQLIICGPVQRAHLLAQLRSDTSFLRSLNIVDYSCMIGVRSRVFTRAEGPSKTIILKEHRGGAWRQTVTSEAIGVGAERARAEDNSCIHGCDRGLLSLPIYTPGDDTTAREDVYYLGIIDVLQEYTPVKRFENFTKGLWSDRTQISVVPPKEYAERLCKVLENVTV